MPTSILVWNIQSFSIHKFNSPYFNRYPAGVGGLTMQQASIQRRWILSDVLLATTPDIFVVVEMSSGDSYPNSLATLTGGMTGATDLLARLRATPALGGNSWRLVPPLRIGRGGKAESMAVYYRGQTGAGVGLINRYFTGPNIWTGGYAGNSVHPGAAAAGAYPGAVGVWPDINQMVVPPGTAVRNIPAGALHNGGGGVPENQVAARTVFQYSDPANPGANGGIDYQVFREPYMATFTETNAAGGQRNITLFGIHSPAVTGNQQVFVTYLAFTHEINAALGANETRVICGDFNLNLLDGAGNDANQYQQLTNLGYNVMLTPAGGPPAGLAAYKGYFATHIKRASDRTAASKFLWSQNGGNQAFYPGYEYIGSRFVPNLYSIDNILVNPAPGAPATTVMNNVMGTPLNAVAMPPGNPPVGAVAMGHGFYNLPMGYAWPQAPTANNYPGIGGANQLCGWGNYGRIYSTSDHFALYTAV